MDEELRLLAIKNLIAHYHEYVGIEPEELDSRINYVLDQITKQILDIKI